MKVRVASISLLVALLFLPTISLGQEQTPFERKPIDWFYIEADYRPDTQLLKLLQFTARFPGSYQRTFVEMNGTASRTHVVPNWAEQGGGYAKLNDAVLAQIKQLLAQLKVPSTPGVLEPLKGHLHSAFIFHNGREFVRWNFNGPVPAQIEAILAILDTEFKATAEVRRKEFAAHRKLMKETYGDWQNRPGITLNAGGLMHACKGKTAHVVTTVGQRKTGATSSPVNVSLYHALVIHPRAWLAGSGSGGRWSDDPVQSYVMSWRLRNADGTYTNDSPERKFEMLHHAIDATVTIGGKTYQLNRGNMFVVRIGADWQPTVTQLNEVFEEQATPQASLNRFKSILKNDAEIQQLELY